MRSYILSIDFAASLFVLISTVRPGLSETVGCDGPNIECLSKQAVTDSEVCGFNEDGTGVVSFDSNITTEGPLARTVGALNAPDSKAHPSPMGRAFYLGTPPSLNLSEATDFGACTAFLCNLTSALQLPTGISDFNDFSYDSVMEPQCAQDVIVQAHNELLRLLEDASYDAARDVSPCTMV